MVSEFYPIVPWPNLKEPQHAVDVAQTVDDRSANNGRYVMFKRKKNITA